MNDDRINEGGAEEQAGPLWPRWPDRAPRRAVWAGVAILTGLVLALALVEDIHRHLDAEERAAAVPVRPDFGRR